MKLRALVFTGLPCSTIFLRVNALSVRLLNFRTFTGVFIRVEVFIVQKQNSSNKENSNITFVTIGQHKLSSSLVHINEFI